MALGVSLLLTRDAVLKAVAVSSELSLQRIRMKSRIQKRASDDFAALRKYCPLVCPLSRGGAACFMSSVDTIPACRPHQAHQGVMMGMQTPGRV